MEHQEGGLVSPDEGGGRGGGEKDLLATNPASSPFIVSGHQFTECKTSQF